jgi:hypothetical protein
LQRFFNQQLQKKRDIVKRNSSSLSGFTQVKQLTGTVKPKMLFGRLYGRKLENTGNKETLTKTHALDGT